MTAENDRETKRAAEARCLPWFKFTYCEAIKNGRASGERLEMSGPITKEEARKLFRWLLSKEPE